MIRLHVVLKIQNEQDGLIGRWRNLSFPTKEGMDGSALHIEAMINAKRTGGTHLVDVSIDILIVWSITNQHPHEPCHFALLSDKRVIVTIKVSKSNNNANKVLVIV